MKKKKNKTTNQITDCNRKTISKEKNIFSHIIVSPNIAVFCFPSFLLLCILHTIWYLDIKDHNLIFPVEQHTIIVSFNGGILLWCRLSVGLFDQCIRTLPCDEMNQSIGKHGFNFQSSMKNEWVFTVLCETVKSSSNGNYWIVLSWSIIYIRLSTYACVLCMRLDSLFWSCS